MNLNDWDVYNTYEGASLIYRCYYNAASCLSTEAVDWTLGDMALVDTEVPAVLGVADTRSEHSPITVASDDHGKTVTCTTTESGASRMITVFVNGMHHWHSS